MLEIILLCLQRTSRNGSDSWRAHLLSTLCLGDAMLLERLWDEGLDSEAEIAALLKAVAAERNWDRERLLVRGMKFHDILHIAKNKTYTELTEQQYPLWRIGALGFDEDYGPALSSVALHAFGKNAEIRHRIWLGQIGLIFPLLDKLRLIMCAILTRKYGNGWPIADGHTPHDPKEISAIRESPYNCQFGRLEIALRNLPERPKKRRKYCRYLEQARNIRNELAHNRPIELSAFSGLLRDIDNLSHAEYAD